MTTKEFFFHPATIITGIILLIALVLIVGYHFFGWFKKDAPDGETKEQRCARLTGFNLADLDPKASTATQGIFRKEFDECMAKA